MKTSNLLAREEYVEQAYLFKALAERMSPSEPAQELLKFLREEILTTTNLPMAIDFILAELNHVGTMATAMRKMPHYFSPFQTFVIASAEDDRGRFEIRRAMRVLEHEARYRSEQLAQSSLFFYQFETISRNRLDYDYGLQAVAADPAFDEDWTRWILQVRHKIGMVELADLVYVHSQYYLDKQKQDRQLNIQTPDPLLFDEKEGRIALANRVKDPRYLFAALQRQLNYPEVPRPPKSKPADEILPKLMRTVERLEVRLKLLEDEQRSKGIDLSKFFEGNNPGLPE